MERTLQVGGNDVQPRTSSRPSQLGQASPFTIILDMLFLCMKNWLWFVLALAVTLGIAYYSIKSTPNVYYRSASIMIKGDDRNFASSNALKELGIDQTPSSVTNEILSLRTVDVAAEIVKRLGLDVNCYHPSSFQSQLFSGMLSNVSFYDKLAYGSDLPVKVSFPDLNDHETVTLDLKLSKDSTISISNIVYNGQQLESKGSFALGKVATTAFGKIKVEPSPYYKPGTETELKVKRISRHAAISNVLSRINPYLADKNSTLITISYTDNSPFRADDVLNTLVTVYNENWVKDRNRITISTNEFIKDRLSVIEQELGSVENDISTYKAEHLMTSPEQMGALAVNRADAAEQQSYAIDNQIYMTRYVRSYLTDGLHANQLLPTNSGINNQSIEQQINNYNTILLQRNNHLANSSEQNPLVMDLDQNLAIMRGSIIQSLDNELTLLNTQRRSIETSHSRAVSKIASNPEQTTYLLSVERQQKVKESLYLFLLQKREENELSQAFTAYNSRLIEPPHGSYDPILPVPKRTYMLAIIIGLAIPATIIIVKELFNTTVRGRKDLEQCRLPFVGEIPLERVAAKEHSIAQRNANRLKKKNKGQKVDMPTPKLLVVAKSRNAINEAFRVVRSNLEFVLGFDSSHKVIMLTSMNPGSGKTFITANLSASIGLKGKRVLAIDLDMRKRSLSKYLNNPRKGVSNYLSGQIHDYHDVVVSSDHFDMLPCGSLPPNPSELLYTDRFKAMMESVRKEYDFVVIDCPPVEVVADAAIINRYVDMTLFVVRAHLMDRSFLDDIEKWYEEKRYTNLSILLNGTTESFSHYGYHRYGYRYGYRYGNYGYGYGYGYGQNEKPEPDEESLEEA